MPEAVEGDLVKEFLALWARWSDSFSRDVSLELHADIDAEFRAFAADKADGLAAALSRAEAERDERDRMVLEVIDTEPELPGPMPPELQFSSNTEDYMRAAVRATKKSIRERVVSRLSRASQDEV